MGTINNEAKIRSALNLLVDSAIAVETALSKENLDELDAAIRAIKQNSDAAQGLLIAWIAAK